MTIDEYKEAILHNLGISSDCEAVEQIIHRSIEKLKEKHVHASLVIDYLNQLKESLEELTPHGFDSVHWCNIKCAILYLKKILRY
jgi:hypothetical protein